MNADLIGYVSEYENKEEESSTIYELMITHDDSTWYIYHSYSDIRDFRNTLLKALRETQSWAPEFYYIRKVLERSPFPPRRIFGSKSITVITERMDKLQGFLEQVTIHVFPVLYNIELNVCLRPIKRLVDVFFKIYEITGQPVKKPKGFQVTLLPHPSSSVPVLMPQTASGTVQLSYPIDSSTLEFDAVKPKKKRVRPKRESFRQSGVVSFMKQSGRLLTPIQETCQ